MGFLTRYDGGDQGASRAAPEKSGLHACGQADRVIALESWEGLGNEVCVFRKRHTYKSFPHNLYFGPCSVGRQTIFSSFLGVLRFD